MHSTDRGLALLQDAVEVALRIDRDTAVAVASRPEDDVALQRKLWLAIARHIIHSAAPSDDGSPVCCGMLGLAVCASTSMDYVCIHT